MGENSAIAWTNHTFNPWIGCQRVSPGCVNCYAEALDARWRPNDSRWGPAALRTRTSKALWSKPFHWNKRAALAGIRERVFCASLADVFEDRPELAPWRADLFRVVQFTPHLDWLLLTKRPENAHRMWTAAQVDAYEFDGKPIGPTWGENIWLGTTIEDQRRAVQRIPHLLDVPARVRFLSVEPQLEAVNLTSMAGGPCPDCGGPTSLNVLDPSLYCSACCECSPGEPLASTGIDWVIQGGESGPGARAFDVEWARDLASQCEEGGAAYFLKQLGRVPVDGAAHPSGLVQMRLKDGHGGDMAEWPEDLQKLGRAFPVPKGGGE